MILYIYPFPMLSVDPGFICYYYLWAWRTSALLVKQIWRWLILFFIFYLKMALFHLLSSLLLDVEFLVVCFQHFINVVPLCLGPISSPVCQVATELWVFCMSFSPHCFKTSSLFSNSLSVMCFGVVFFVLFLLGIHWTSWICYFMYFIKYREFTSIIFSNSICLVYSLSLPLLL